MYVSPDFTALIFPVLSTVATPESLEVQLYGSLDNEVSFPYVTLAVITDFFPSDIVYEA